MLYDMMPATFSEFRSYPFPDPKEGKEAKQGKEGKEGSVVEAGKEDNEGMIWKEFFSPFFSGRFVKKFQLVKFFIFFTFYGQKDFLIISRDPSFSEEHVRFTTVSFKTFDIMCFFLS